MIRKICIATILVALAASASAASAKNQRVARLDANGNLDALIARHAAANNLPEDLLRRMIKRESGGNPRVVSKGNFGLMQIKLATARSMGYQRHRRRPARCRHQHDLCGEISRRRLSCRRRQCQPRGALLCRRLLLCRQEQGPRGADRGNRAQRICIQRGRPRTKGCMRRRPKAPSVSPASDRFGAGLELAGDSVGAGRRRAAWSVCSPEQRLEKIERERVIPICPASWRDARDARP